MGKFEDLELADKFLIPSVALQQTLKKKYQRIRYVPIPRREKTNFTNEKLYLRIPTSVDAIIFTMQNGKYNAVLLTKIVLIDLTIYVLPL